MRNASDEVKLSRDERAVIRPVYAFATGHYYDYGDAAAYRIYGTDDHLLMYNISGRGRVGYAGGEFIAEPGSVVVVLPHAMHDYGVDRDASHWERIWTHFHPPGGWLDLLALPKVAPGLLHLPLQAEEVKEQVKRSLVDMHRLATRGIPQSERLAMNALEAALLWCDLENPIGTSARIDARVRKAIEYIITDLTRHLALDVLARHCGLSRSRLSDLFRAQLGMSPQQFQEQHRMERARHLLALTSRSVAEIAVEVGFASQFYFSLRFKKLWGVSPKAYRKRESSRPTAAVGGSSRPRPN